MTDLYKSIRDPLLSMVIDTVGHFDLSRGPWIAGGCPRRLWQGMSWINNDVDCFFSNQQDLAEAQTRLQAVYQQQYDEWTNKLVSLEISSCQTKNAWTYKIYIAGELIQIQLVKSLNPSLVDLWNSFDFTVCKFATDGHTVVADATAVTDVDSRRLRKNFGYGKIKFNRVIKYGFYGFDSDADILAELLQQYQHQTIDKTDDIYV
jgi:hypothetical protein